jgi:hypothetical protein
MDKNRSKESILHQGQNRQTNVVNHLVIYLSMQPRSKTRGLYYQLFDHLESGFDVIPFKISYFKYDDLIHQWIITTCKREVEGYLKCALVQFAQSQDIPIINPSFRVRLKRCQ